MDRELAYMGRYPTITSGGEWPIRDRESLWTRSIPKNGGRRIPLGGFPTLYLNASRKTARCNATDFIRDKLYEPEDFRDESAPTLIGRKLSKEQVVCNLHSEEGLRAVNLLIFYARDAEDCVTEWPTCQKVGAQV